ncbi:membrane progestin receptor gamma-like [Antedon mediterranea]|uniref:membrane progestin receptor gamma-like n=1 Tax=Antedon mediterranea TaxID=105859 RepID=UPI003AF696BF
MWTVRLFRDDQLPSVFHEPFIKTGYRACETSLSECLRSALYGTNETLNFWTHFLPVFYYLWRIWRIGSEHDFINDPYMWPLLGVLICVCLYSLASSVAHLFSCLSERARHVCFFMDYSSIGMYSVACSIAYKCYSFPNNLIDTPYFNSYIQISVVNAVLMCTCGACASRFMDESLLRHLCRLSSFSLPFIICNVPIVYRVFACPGDDCDGTSVALLRWQYLAAAVTALIFATHFPERMAPGRFDVFFHSHQIFHVATTVSSNFHVDAMLADMSQRRDVLESTVGMPTFWNSIGLLSAVFCINALLVLCFSVMIYSSPEPEHFYKIKHSEGTGKRQIAKNYRHRVECRNRAQQGSNVKR